MEDKKIKELIKEGYAKVASQESPCCFPKKEVSSCCSPVKSCCGSPTLAENISVGIGYSKEDLSNVPEGANLGLGCGNPIALASLEEGETVLDLGSGAGLDCFIAANKVGMKGKVIGVDMTPEMIKRARENARKGNFENVEFRLGELENLPVEDNSIDKIISNCVINLSPDKRRVFEEAFRVLKAGGKLMVSDIVLLKELPEFIRDSIDAYIGCISGAILKDQYIELIEEAGFSDVKIIEEAAFPIEFYANDPTARTIIENIEISPDRLKEVVGSLLSVKVQGIK
jgi:arsenite methyltransferase